MEDECVNGITHMDADRVSPQHMVSLAPGNMITSATLTKFLDNQNSLFFWIAHEINNLKENAKPSNENLDNILSNTHPMANGVKNLKEDHEK